MLYYFLNESKKFWSTCICMSMLNMYNGYKERSYLTPRCRVIGKSKERTIS